MSSLPKEGDKIVVYGLLQYEAKVTSIVWDVTCFDWVIQLDWGLHGKSKVNLRDENKIWYRFSEVS